MSALAGPLDAILDLLFPQSHRIELTEVDLETALVALGIIRYSALEQALIIAIAGHVKELRKSKDVERRYGSISKLIEMHSPVV